MIFLTNTDTDISVSVKSIGLSLVQLFLGLPKLCANVGYSTYEVRAYKKCLWLYAYSTRTVRLYWQSMQIINSIIIYEVRAWKKFLAAIAAL